MNPIFLILFYLLVFSGSFGLLGYLNGLKIIEPSDIQLYGSCGLLALALIFGIVALIKSGKPARSVEEKTEPEAVAEDNFLSTDQINAVEDEIIDNTTYIDITSEQYKALSESYQSNEPEKESEDTLRDVLNNTAEVSIEEIQDMVSQVTTTSLDVIWESEVTEAVKGRHAGVDISEEHSPDQSTVIDNAEENIVYTEQLAGLREQVAGITEENMTTTQYFRIPDDEPETVEQVNMEIEDIRDDLFSSPDQIENMIDEQLPEQPEMVEEIIQPELPEAEAAEENAEAEPVLERINREAVINEPLEQLEPEMTDAQPIQSILTETQINYINRSANSYLNEEGQPQLVVTAEYNRHTTINVPELKKTGTAQPGASAAEAKQFEQSDYDDLDDEALYGDDTASTGTRILNAIILILILGIIAVGSYYVYSRYLR